LYCISLHSWPDDDARHNTTTRSEHKSHVFVNHCQLEIVHSVFGEDALVNVSVEKKDDNDGKLAGYIRIRSKTQGIALSLGDRITAVQRGIMTAK